MTPDDQRNRSHGIERNASLRRKSDHSSSIALPRPPTPTLFAWLVSSVLLLSAHAVLAQKIVIVADTSAIDELASLGNTPEDDRLMLREISDSHIFSAGISADVPIDPSSGRPASSESALASPQIAYSTWDFVRQSTRLHIPEHERVSFYLEKYRSEALWIGRILQRASPFVGYVVDELDKRYLPVELALLPAIESGYQPDVLSSQNAAGIWQIIPTTAGDVGITHNTWFDGRSDILESTTAAIDYLSYLNAEFHGDWLLTLAAYNAGPGRVNSAVRRNAKAGLPTDFWSLMLPSETREYVPKFLALVAMLRQERSLDLEIPSVPRGSAFDVVDIRVRASLDKLATLTGISERRLRHLNAGLVHGITPPEGPHRIYLPQGFGKPLTSLLMSDSSLQLHTPPDKHVVAAGDNLSSLAQLYEISQKRLMQLNSLDSSLIRIGQTLTVLDTKGDKPRIDYVVTIGDTLSDIAHRFSVKVSDIRNEQGRQLSSDTIHPGERLSLLTREDSAHAN